MSGIEMKATIGRSSRVDRSNVGIGIGTAAAGSSCFRDLENAIFKSILVLIYGLVVVVYFTSLKH